MSHTTNDCETVIEGPTRVDSGFSGLTEDPPTTVNPCSPPQTSGSVPNSKDLTLWEETDKGPRLSVKTLSEDQYGRLRREEPVQWDDEEEVKLPIRDDPRDPSSQTSPLCNCTKDNCPPGVHGPYLPYDLICAFPSMDGKSGLEIDFPRMHTDLGFPDTKEQYLQQCFTRARPGSTKCTVCDSTLRSRGGSSTLGIGDQEKLRRWTEETMKARDLHRAIYFRWEKLLSSNKRREAETEDQS